MITIHIWFLQYIFIIIISIINIYIKNDQIICQKNLPLFSEVLTSLPLSLRKNSEEQFMNACLILQGNKNDNRVSMDMSAVTTLGKYGALTWLRR